ncbi:unnamed protein product [Gongylonema pulchrum]|uniref:UrcA family protein n=1 Tax=Gongylonema pulchrum TaxID=637853 RepID=A0A183DQ85_9BILA|nr:unnamed protein product [Gongylonema pulchrum]
MPSGLVSGYRTNQQTNETRNLKAITLPASKNLNAFGSQSAASKTGLNKNKMAKLVIVTAMLALAVAVSAAPTEEPSYVDVPITDSEELSDATSTLASAIEQKQEMAAKVCTVFEAKSRMASQCAVQ